jgi:hypothetical protein
MVGLYGGDGDEIERLYGEKVRIYGDFENIQ